MNKEDIKLVFRLAIHGLYTNKGRTVLTAMGIIIGIATIIIVLSTGRGLQAFIDDQISQFGTNTIEVEMKIPSVSNMEMASSFVGGAEVTTLKVADFEALKKLPNIKAYYAGTFGQYKSVYKNETNRSTIFAVSSGMPEVDLQVKMAGGRFFTEREDKAQARVVILGQKVKKDLFVDENPIGKSIKINHISFKVIGLMEPRGMISILDYDKMIFMPLTTAQKQLLGINHVMYGFVTVEDMNRVDETVAGITEMMRRLHGLPANEPDKYDFRVTSMKEAMEMAGTVTFGVTVLILLIAGISLIVGGVGIMNIMYLSVVERTREIGLRKAVGATSGMIQSQFLVEASLITVLGGIIGVILGTIIVYLLRFILALNGYNFEMSIGVDSIFVGLFSATIFGILFGLYPARKASTLSPVDALRFE